MQTQIPPLKFKVIDLFCGAGGLSEGFRQAGCTIIAGVDHDPDAIATYAHNFPEATAICGDVRDAKIRQRIMEVGAGCDVVVGGPPCQAYSQVRNHTRLIDDPRNSLYREFVTTVKVLRPAMFIMENVPGMDQMGVRTQIEDDLALGGQYLVRSKKLDAANFGVPQTRERLIFIGVQKASNQPIRCWKFGYDQLLSRFVCRLVGYFFLTFSKL